MRTYYDVLGVLSTAEPEVITATYASKKKSLFNSGIYPDDAEYIKVEKAYACLSDYERRRNYDIKISKLNDCTNNTENSQNSNARTTVTNENKTSRWFNEHKTALFISSLSVIILVVMSCLVPSSEYNWTKVDHEETFHDETYVTGSYDVHSTSNRICHENEDYLSCVNATVAMYNSVCANKSLTLSASLTCNEIDKFIDDVKQKYENCGYGCTTGSSDWGWDYYSAIPETATRKISNEDEVHHTAYCYSNVWGIKWGECR